MTINKPLTYIILTTSALIAAGCSTDSEKLDKAITREFKIVRDSKRFREDFRKSDRLIGRANPNVPYFMNREARLAYDDENMEWHSQVPVGKYFIDGATIEIESSYYNDFKEGFSGMEPQKATIKTSEGTIDMKFELDYSHGWTVAIQVLEAKFNRKKYFKSNSEDRPLIDTLNHTMNKYLPIIDSIDQAEIKQYRNFRAKFIADRNEAVVSSMKQKMLR